MNKPSTSKSPRLYYLDWLRVLAFGLLIIVNCGEVFAGPSWWIQNTETIPTIGYVLKFFPSMEDAAVVYYLRSGCFHYS